MMVGKSLHIQPAAPISTAHRTYFVCRNCQFSKKRKKRKKITMKDMEMGREMAAAGVFAHSYNMVHS